MGHWAIPVSDLRCRGWDTSVSLEFPKVAFEWALISVIEAGELIKVALWESYSITVGIGGDFTAFD